MKKEIGHSGLGIYNNLQTNLKLTSGSKSQTIMLRRISSIFRESIVGGKGGYNGKLLSKSRGSFVITTWRGGVPSNCKTKTRIGLKWSKHTFTLFYLTLLLGRLDYQYFKKKYIPDLLHAVEA